MKKGLRRLRGSSDGLNANMEMPSDRSIAAKLADEVEVTVSGDYGADHAAICAFHVEKLALANIFVQILPLMEPITMELAVHGRDEPLVDTAKRKARVSMTLKTGRPTSTT